MNRLAGTMVAIIAGLAGAAASAGAGGQSAGQWPQFLGPDRTGISMETIAKSATLSIAWRTPLPAGRAAIVVAGSLAYTLGGPEGSNDEQEYLLAIDTATGRERWRAAIGKAIEGVEPAATPAIVGAVVVAVSSSCAVHGINAVTGASVWQRDLVKEFQSRFAARGGCAMSPLIDGAHVVLPTGASAGVRLAAFHAATGETAWTTSALPSSVNVPAGITGTGSDRLVLYHHAKPPGTSGLSAVRATSGEVVWQLDLPSGMSETVPVALSASQVVLQTWTATSLIDSSSPAPRIVWSTPAMSSIGPPPLAHGASLFGWGGNSGEYLTCIDATTGATRWTERIYRGYGVKAGDVIVIQSEASGLLRLIAADATGYRELARLAVLRPGARTTSPPALSGGRVFVRNLEEMVAVNLK